MNLRNDGWGLCVSPVADQSLDDTKVTTYSFETHRKTSQIRLLDIESGQSALLVDDLSASEPTWIGDDEFLYLKSGEKGNTTVLVDKIARPGSQ